MSNTHKESGFDVLNDPIIRQMMRADRVSRAELSQLLRDVAATLGPTFGREQTSVVVRRAMSTAQLESHIPRF